MKHIAKTIKRTAMVAALLFAATACEHNFDEMNTNTTALPTIDPVLLLNGATLNASYTSGASGGSGLIYDASIVQQIVSPVLGLTSGGNFNKENRGASATLWQNYYPNVIRNTKAILEILDQDPTNTSRDNLRQMTRILQAYAFMVLTDEYGDIPYTQAGLGFIDQNFFPEYTPQPTIYTDLIKELTEASAALNVSGRIETSDVLYKGDVAKWKKFGYSLLLRAGMRLSKVDRARAQTVAAAAFAGGVILTNADNAVIRHDASNTNGFGNTLNSTEAANYYLAAPFVDYLQDTNDPRLKAIAVRYVGAASGADQGVGKPSATTDPAQQVGMPIGASTTSAVVGGVGKYFAYSQVDRGRIATQLSPLFLVTAAQCQLLLAEARHENWITTGDEATYYNAGVRLHMEQMASYSAASAIAATDIDNYLLANPYVPADGLEMINTQYWIASFLNTPEAYANFRRSGFPALDPNPATGQDISSGFIRRLQYPTSEVSVNATNLELAVTRMGGERMDTPVWWDGGK